MGLERNLSEPTEQHYDVIIVGGSVAGCATALSIHNSRPDASILVLDDADPTAFKIGESLPAIAKHVISKLSPRLLERISEAQRGQSDGVFVRCSGNASCWGSPELEEAYAIFNPFGMGWHLDRAKFDQLLRETMVNVSQNKIWLVKGTFEDASLADGEKHWLVSTSDILDKRKMVYTSKWLVDSSGRKAVAARKLGAKTVREDSLLAFYAVFTRPSITDDGDYRTMIEASESGWWYSSPLPGNRRIVAYHTDDSDPTAHDARQLDGFMNLLHYSTTHISRLISESEYDMDVTPQGRYPMYTAASSSRTEPPCGSVSDMGPRWCAVGDAAMAFDPLSSQGMVTALNLGGVVGEIIAQDTNVNVSGGDALSAIPTVYSQVWSKYNREKLYYYSQGRFDGKFWESRR